MRLHGIFLPVGERRSHPRLKIRVYFGRQAGQTADDKVESQRRDALMNVGLRLA